MKIYPNNSHQFKGKTTFALWDNEENGGYGHFSDRDEAITEAGKIMSNPSDYGHIPYMLLVVNNPGGSEYVTNRIQLEA